MMQAVPLVRAAGIRPTQQQLAQAMQAALPQSGQPAAAELELQTPPAAQPAVQVSTDAAAAPSASWKPGAVHPLWMAPPAMAINAQLGGLVSMLTSAVSMLRMKPSELQAAAQAAAPAGAAQTNAS